MAAPSPSLSPQPEPGDLDKDSSRADEDGEEADLDKMSAVPARKKRGRPPSLAPGQARGSSGKDASKRAEGEKEGESGTSMQKKLKLTMPIHKFAKQLKAQSHTKRMGGGTAVIMTSVIEYVVSEILELAGNTAVESKKNRIVPRHIQQAVRNDEELNKFLANVTIAGGGVIPNVHSTALPKKEKKPQSSAARAAVPIHNQPQSSTLSQEF